MDELDGGGAAPQSLRDGSIRRPRCARFDRRPQPPCSVYPIAPTEQSLGTLQAARPGAWLAVMPARSASSAHGAARCRRSKSSASTACFARHVALGRLPMAASAFGGLERTRRWTGVTLAGSSDCPACPARSARRRTAWEMCRIGRRTLAMSVRFRAWNRPFTSRHPSSVTSPHAQVGM